MKKMSEIAEKAKHKMKEKAGSKGSAMGKKEPMGKKGK